MKKSYEAIIIGGGIAGCAAAFELAKRGMTNVLLVEKSYLTSGATGRCGAGIRQQWGSKLNATLAAESVSVFEHLEEYTGYDKSCGLSQHGYLMLACNEKEWAQFQKNLAVQHELGVCSRAVSVPDGVREIVPFIHTEGLVGATFCPKDGYADPFHCTYAYADGAKRLGVTMMTYTAVTQLLAEKGKIKGVRTNKGDFCAPTVLNAANVWAPALAAQVGDNIPVIPERHQAAVTEPVAPLCPSGPMPMVMSFSRHFFVQQTTHGSVIMGVSDGETDTFNISSSWQNLEETCSTICYTLPALRKLRVVRQWVGLNDASPDRAPVIEISQNAEGLITECGFSGHGFLIGPRTAILVANAITGQPDGIDIKMFSSARYQTGNILVEPSVISRAVKN